VISVNNFILKIYKDLSAKIVKNVTLGKKTNIFIVKFQKFVNTAIKKISSFVNSVTNGGQDQKNNIFIVKNAKNA
jgi:hypothetical protein